jgi:formylglycine-generating enzyme required for sulfatase activity
MGFRVSLVPLDLGTFIRGIDKLPEPSRPDTPTQQIGEGSIVDGRPKELSFDFGGDVKMEMVLIPAGEFPMGSPDSDKNAHSDEKPQHRVRITKPFYLGKYPVTQEQWEALMGGNPSSFSGPKNPVDTVAWAICQKFLEKLNRKFDAKPGKFELPTEAQWEYACRAGSTTRYCFGDDESQLSKYAWYGKNSGVKTHTIGEKKPNAWGLYDMHGNIWEWCADWYDGYKSFPVDDPSGPATGTTRVIRGGGGKFAASLCRSASRIHFEPWQSFSSLGFRVCLIPPEKWGAGRSERGAQERGGHVRLWKDR